MRRVLGDVGRGTAVFAAQCEALQHAQDEKEDRGRDADGGRARQDPDKEGGCTHDQDGDEERVLTSDKVAEAAEDESAEGANQETRGEGEQGKDVPGR